MGRIPPIYSTLEDQPEHHEAIDRFVVGLGEQVDLLQDLEAAGRLVELAEASRALAERATRAGYPPLADVAGEAARAAARGKREGAHDALVELTEQARRVRLGHRGAA